MSPSNGQATKYCRCEECRVIRANPIRIYDVNHTNYIRIYCKCNDCEDQRIYFTPNQNRMRYRINRKCKRQQIKPKPYSIRGLQERFKNIIILGDECELCSETDNICRIQLPCKHELHDTCIFKWSRRFSKVTDKPTCPMCRAEF